MPDPDLELREGGSHPDPEIRGGGHLSKNFFAFQASVWFTK